MRGKSALKIKFISFHAFAWNLKEIKFLGSFESMNNDLLGAHKHAPLQSSDSVSVSS